MPPLPPIISNYTRSPDGLTGTVEVSQVEPADICAIFAAGLASGGQPQPLAMVGNRFGSGECTLSFAPLLAEPTIPALIFAVTANAQNEATLSETVSGPLPRLALHLEARRRPEIIRR